MAEPRRTPGDFSPNQHKALAALISTGSVKGAAESCGLGQRTIERYLADPDFRKRYREERAWLTEQAVAAAQKLSASAVAVIGRNLTSDNATIQLRAAKMLLDFMVRGQEMVDQQGQIEELQALLADMQSEAGGE